MDISAAEVGIIFVAWVGFALAFCAVAEWIEKKRGVD